MQPNELYMLWQEETQRFVAAIDGFSNDVYLCFTDKDIADQECARQNEMWNLDSSVLRVK